ncbi:MAG: hypothetical protein IPI16_13105 [Comamonadaceae bacterium]|nr:hypothetical protein [Comamonadaceae bacterium]
MQSFINQGWEFGASGSLSAAADGQGGMFTGRPPRPGVSSTRSPIPAWRPDPARQKFFKVTLN